MMMDERFAIELCIAPTINEDKNYTDTYSGLKELENDYPEEKWDFGYRIVDTNYGGNAEDTLDFYANLNDAYEDYKRIKHANEMVEVQITYEENVKVCKTYKISRAAYSDLTESKNRMETEGLLQYYLGDDYDSKEIFSELQYELAPRYDISVEMLEK